MDWNNKRPLVDHPDVPPYYTGLISDYMALIHKEVLDFVEDSMPGFAVEQIESRATSEYYDKFKNLLGMDDELGELKRVEVEFKVRTRSLREPGMFMSCKVMVWDGVMNIGDVTMEVYR